MPRPITKDDIKKIRSFSAMWNERLVVKKHKLLGFYVLDENDNELPFSYQAFDNPHCGWAGLSWITLETFRRRQKLGHPKPRKKAVKQLLREPDFGLEEMALAEAIMNGG
jgi:hypothetical protein